MNDRWKWDSWKIAIPSALTYNLADDRYNWDYHTTPQTKLNNRQIAQPRGKCLGGSSSLNAMVYIRGHALDYERWEKEDGVEGWGYADVLPYFKKAQSHHLGGDTWRGGDGPLTVTNGSQLSAGKSSELFDVFVDAAAELGYNKTDDLNGYMQEGFGPMDQTVKANGVRNNTSECYLRPALSTRDNLTLETDSLVTKILMNDNNTRAIGVSYTNKITGEEKTLYANKEVISCLGSIGSPQLLNVSGIGKGQDLSDVGIAPIHELDGVGSNLQDHLEFYVQYLCTKPVTLYPVGNWMPYPHKRILVGLEWILQGE